MPHQALLDDPFTCSTWERRGDRGAPITRSERRPKNDGATGCGENGRSPTRTSARVRLRPDRLLKTKTGTVIHSRLFSVVVLVFKQKSDRLI